MIFYTGREVKERNMYKGSTKFLNTFPPPEMMVRSYLMAERPFRIWGNLYYVGNSWCASHLIDTGDGLILLDTGCYAELPYLLDAVWSLGFDPRMIQIIIVSHAHHDHYGAARALKDITGAEIYFGAVDAQDMEKRPAWFEEHNRNRDCKDEGFEADHLLEDGEHILLGNTDIRCILTPGHTLGTMSHFWTAWDRQGDARRVGIYGGSGFGTVRTDFLLSAGLPLSLQKSFADSLEKVRGEQVDIMLGNHPCHNDTFSKHRKELNGEADAFVDRDEWLRFLGELGDSYQSFLQLSKEEQGQLFEKSYFVQFCGDHAAAWMKKNLGK